jgi:hypothetical protein
MTLEGSRCIEPTGCCPVEEIILCLFHREEECAQENISHYLISATFILKDATLEPLLTQLTQQNVDLRYTHKHPLIKERRPFIGLFCGSQQPINAGTSFSALSSWDYENFFTTNGKIWL